MALRAKQWLALTRPGDWLVLALLGACTVQLFGIFAGRGPVDRAVIRRDGEVIAEVMLAVKKRIEVQGPLGITVVEIEPGRARIAADPGARQLCVRQGWLDRANATALCLPNYISLQVQGKAARHDTLVY
ncbi:MAG: NusG domain II-containing protein [Rhodocyclaceae bacterium]|nr:NusG domain II-containing protein [Rhodocyclaceae bacterium]